MSATYLDEILRHHRRRAEADQRSASARRVQASGVSLLASLTAHREQGLAVIAEVKRRSPSKGVLRESLDPVALARAYHAGGAAAISVLTDEEHFGGSTADLRAVREATPLPILRKDFTVSVNDVLDTAEMGASAVLLIVAALSDDELREFLRVATDVGLDALVEVHDEQEADRALAAGARLVGVNQRDLRTFAVDTERATRVANALEGAVLTVAESGLGSPQAAAAAAEQGFDAILVGEAFVRSDDPEVTVRSFSGFPVRVRS